jgi:hypothetical protein
MRFALALIMTLLTPALARAEAGSADDSRGRMRAFRINGFELSGAEYWPFKGSDPFRYPQDVLWGFYPDQVSEQAVNCAWVAYLDLQSYFRSNPARLRKAVNLGATERFYLWVNDYSRASEERPRRPHRLWHSASNSQNPDGYTTGYWKWESTLAQDGTCLIPQADQIAKVLDEAIRSMLSRPRNPSGVTH